jgi:hypothetical protein
MSKIFKLSRLSDTFPILLVVVAVSLFVSCQPAGREGGQPINADTVKNHVITIGQADQMTASFRTVIDSLNKKVPGFKDSVNFGHAEAFPADVFRELLRQTDSTGPVAGIRIYYGRDPNGSIHQILVPYDSNGNDIVRQYVELINKPQQGVHVEALMVRQGQALENGARCPTVCGNDSSGLN